MKCNDISKIKIPKRYVNRKARADEHYQPRKYKPKHTTALDTETFQGTVTLICAYGDEFKDYMIVYKHTPLTDILEFLTQPKLRRSHNFFFNTAYDKDGILKLLPYEKYDELITHDQVYYEGYKITLIGNRVFDVAKVYKSYDKKIKEEVLKTKHTTHYADIIKFYKKFGGLEKTVQAIIDKDYKKPMDIGTGIEARKITQEHVDYCMDDAFRTWQLSKFVTKHAGDMFNINRYYSPATLSKAFIRQQRPDYMFRWNNIQKIHFQSYGGGRFEIFSKGFFGGGKFESKVSEDHDQTDSKKDRIRMADINSAYPYHMNDLYYPTGTHFTSKQYEPDAIYSGYVVDVRVTDDLRMSPLRRLHNNLWVYPTGTVKDLPLCKTEFELLQDLDYPMKIKRGYHMLNPEPVKWLEGIEEAYIKRKQSSAGDNHIIKLFLNSTYGCTCELVKKTTESKNSWTHQEENEPNNSLMFYEDTPILLKKDWYAGRYFNPCISAEVTARTRSQIFHDFHKVEDKVVMIQTDSVAMKGKLPVKDSDKLGGWGHYPDLYGFVMASGIYHFDGYFKKDRDFSMTKNRGVIYDIAKNEKIDLEKLFRGNLQKQMVLTKTRPKSLKEALPKKYKTLNHTKRKNMTNIFLPYEKTFNPNLDKKRVWDSEFPDFDSILKTQIDSRPLKFGR